MLKKLFKFVLGVIAALSAFVAIKELFPEGIIKDNRWIDAAVSLAVCISAFFIIYFIFAAFIKNFPRILDWIETYLKDRKYTPYEFLLGCIGMIIGLIIANLICIPIMMMKFIGIPITLIANFMFAYIGLFLILRFKDDRLFARLKSKFYGDEEEENSCKLLDTSAIIDGRIFDIVLAGFVEGGLEIPKYVIDELGTLADSEDPVKRAKGRKGLDLLRNMQKEFGDTIQIGTAHYNPGQGVDELLLETASTKKRSIITNDFNLNKIAGLRNIKVLNINELANALKPLANVGDQIVLVITKQGKERQQGIGYLESGTMVVVENCRDKVGESVTAIVTSVIQTQAGRMIFANLFGI